MTQHVKMLAAAVAAALCATPALAAAPKKTPEMIAKGKASYDINCASCHGPKGLCDGVAAKALTPKPRNLVADKFTAGAKPDQIFATLGKGMPGTAMVSFGHLPEEERWGLAYYVAELRGGKPAKK